MNRRDFIQTGTGVASGLLLLKSKTVFGSEAELGGAAGAAGVRQSRDFGGDFVLEEHDRAGRGIGRYIS